MPTQTIEHKRFHRQAHLSTPTGRPKFAHKRLRRIPGLWARLAMLALVVVALLTGMVGLTLKAIRPYRQAKVEAASLADTRRRVAALQLSNAALEQRIVYLKTPQGIAAEAHPLGYVRPGEKILVMTGLPAANAQSDDSLDPAPSAPASTPRSLVGRFWTHLRDL